MASSVSAEHPVRRRFTPRDSFAPSPRVSLQRISRGTMRRHLWRSVGRVVTLLAADSMAYLVARAVSQALRDDAILGSAIASALGRTVPLGFLGGWEYGAALLLGLAVTNNYGRGDLRRDSRRLLSGVALGTGLALWHALWGLGLAAVALQFGVTTLGVWVTLVLERKAIDTVVGWLLPAARQAERVVFVGDPRNPLATKVRKRLAADRGMAALGWITANGAMGDGIIGKAQEVWEVLHQTTVDTVILCGRLSDELFETVVNASIAAGCRLLAVPRYEGLADLRPGLVWERGLPLVELTVPSLKARQLLIKRIIDLIGSAIGLVVLAPLFLIVAAAIKLDSPGSVFFSQERVGFGGRIFRMLKFRTMRDGADGLKSEFAHLNCTGDPRLFKIPNDPRVTRVGAWLRRWSLDELPQLFNVVTGSMSLVGPRPFFEADLAGYLDHHFVRLGAKPGITGLWQVRGRSDVVDFEEVVRLDREYIDRWSLWIDVRILIATFPAVLGRTGAY